MLHGDPVKENADMFLQVPGDSVLADHKHTSAERCDNVYKQAALRVIHRFRPADRRHPRDPLIPGEEYRAGRQPEER